jgi:TolB-like protein
MFTLMILYIFVLNSIVGNDFCLYAQQGRKATIAVLSFEVREGLSKSGAATLSDRLRTELVTDGVFTVLERGQMYTILQEQGFNQTGCTTSECAVEAGRLLGVQQMVAGEVGKVGNVLTLDARVFDVETGKILQAYQFDYKGEISGLLDVIKKVSNKISGIEEDKGFPWLWVSLGIAVVGAVTALVISKDKEEVPPTKNDLPDPIWPPGQ